MSGLSERLVRSLTIVEGEAHLPAEVVRSAVLELGHAAAPEAVASELIALAWRLHALPHSLPAMQQLMLLAAHALGDPRAAGTLLRTGSTSAANQRGPAPAPR